MARTVKFKNDTQKQNYLDFLSYLELRIPAHRMPTNKYYTQFNTAIKTYINKSANFENIDNILDITDIDALNKIRDSIENQYAYIKRDDKSMLEIAREINLKDLCIIIYSLTSLYINDYFFTASKRVKSIAKPYHLLITLYQ